MDKLCYTMHCTGNRGKGFSKKNFAPPTPHGNFRKGVGNIEHPKIRKLQTTCKKYIRIRNRSEHFGRKEYPALFFSVRFGSCRFGSVRFGSVWPPPFETVLTFLSDRFGSDRFGSFRFSVAEALQWWT